MKGVSAIVEAVITSLIVGTVALTGAAFLFHATAIKPEYRADLTQPPAHIYCLHDNEGHCWIRGKE